MNKKQAERAHAKRRMRERYGCDLSRDELQRIIGAIRKAQDERAEFVSRISTNRSLWLVQHAGNWIPAVYDKRRQEIVTFLPNRSELRRAYGADTSTHQGSDLHQMRPGSDRAAECAAAWREEVYESREP